MSPRERFEAPLDFYTPEEWNEMDEPEWERPKIGSSARPGVVAREDWK